MNPSVRRVHLLLLSHIKSTLSSLRGPVTDSRPALSGKLAFISTSGWMRPGSISSFGIEFHSTAIRFWIACVVSLNPPRSRDKLLLRSKTPHARTRPPYRRERNLRMRFKTVGSLSISHAHTVRTFHPSSRSLRSFSASRTLFFVSLGIQYRFRDSGTCAALHPSC